MRETTFTDEEGRMWAVLIPDHESDDRAHLGMRLGPPDLREFAAERGWGQDFEVRLHNHLYHRRIFYSDDERELRRRAGDIIQAIVATAKVDAMSIIDLILRDPAILSLEE